MQDVPCSQVIDTKLAKTEQQEQVLKDSNKSTQHAVAVIVAALVLFSVLVVATLQPKICPAPKNKLSTTKQKGN